MKYPMLYRSLEKELVKLNQKKFREEKREFLAEGVRLCQELLLSPITTKQVIFSERLLEHPDGEKLLHLANSKKIPIVQTSEDSLARLGDTQHPQSIIAWAEQRDHTWSFETFAVLSRILVLVDVSDPGNIGTLLRTAEAFAWDGVIFIGDIDMYNPKIVRSSMGALFRLPCSCTFKGIALSFFEDTNCIPILTVPRNGEVYPMQNIPQKLALFLGSEAHGLPDALNWKKARRLQLPMAQNVESLNVAVAGGIFLFLLAKNTKR